MKLEMVAADPRQQGKVATEPNPHTHLEWLLAVGAPIAVQVAIGVSLMAVGGRGAEQTQAAITYL